jgi:hypothetical protein
VKWAFAEGRSMKERKARQLVPDCDRAERRLPTMTVGQGTEAVIIATQQFLSFRAIRSLGRPRMAC